MKLSVAMIIQEMYFKARKIIILFFIPCQSALHPGDVLGDAEGTVPNMLFVNLAPAGCMQSVSHSDHTEPKKQDRQYRYNVQLWLTA